MGNNDAAIADCTAALAKNPDSAKSLKIRGKAYVATENWEAANTDFAKAMRCDPDPATQTLMKEVQEKAVEIKKEKLAAKRAAAAAEEEERKAMRERVKREREEARARQEAEAAAGGGMGGGMGGMGGMGGGMGGGGGNPMAGMMDPEIQELMMKPNVKAVLEKLQTDTSLLSVRPPSRALLRSSIYACLPD
jgi:tetratricopeptide (TPR) repeat protein|tara:strand:- start:392 stop:967 length:576 start_codon:yes stop_codon:yes gene_type:complete